MKQNSVRSVACEGSVIVRDEDRELMRLIERRLEETGKKLTRTNVNAYIRTLVFNDCGR